MNLLFFCPRWGSEHLSWNDFFAKVKHAGYDGVEMSLPEDEAEGKIISDGLREHQLRFIGQHWETTDSDLDVHAEAFARRLRRLANAQPLFINTQTGKDHFTFAQNESLISLAATLAKQTGIPIVHETHRGKFSFASHITKQYLEALPSLRLTLDVSHWCTVAETFLHDQPEALALAIGRTDHIHARVGFTQGPQVNDPQAPEWKEALDFHLSCWDRVVEDKKRRGVNTVTITPEFGAPPYLPLHPYTLTPLADQWASNVFMMELLKKRYQEF
ncbi:sugar phosphate isomerase/epimerase family protein [Chryseolinea lacunae]|uniref:Sugar phosphate isomerase/epimerase n=1 Tax=Chryseolinea lacunae TaxID=2801331 RepID=A0ABS1KUJ0_9BACT|nr:sugar phosphate isomerase/epimerase [Chryseolinea lacunae]MBL0743115.1 sugar phosphate isomerase/epimerase [Chryseolinea lacunae]